MESSRFQLRRNLAIVFAARCCLCGISAGIPTITELWREKGMSQGDFYLLEAFFLAALALLEVITGNFADRCGKVRTLILGFVSLAIGASIYCIADRLSVFLVAEVFLAFGLALQSGTDESLFYQSCKALSEEDSFKSRWIWCNGVGFVSMAAFAIVGAQLSTFGYEVPFMLCAGMQILGLLFCLFLREPPIEGGPPRGDLMSACKAILLSGNEVRWMAIAPGFIIGINQSFLWMYPTILKDCGISASGSGYVFAAFNLTAGVASLWLAKSSGFSNAVRIYFALVVMLLSSTLGLVVFVGGVVWLLILPQQIVRPISGTLFSETINRSLPDSVRTTALSIRNALRACVCAGAMIPWWLGIEPLGRGGMFSVSIVALISGATILWITCPREVEA